MEEVGVSLIPTIIPDTTSVEPYSYEKKNGDKVKTVNEFFVTSQIQYVWINNDNPEDRIIVPWFMTGNQEDMIFAVLLSLSIWHIEHYLCAEQQKREEKISTVHTQNQVKPSE